MRPGERVAIVGCGGVGLSALLGAAAAGAGVIVAVDTVQGKLDVARELGATSTVLWAGSPEATAEAVRDPSGRRHRLRDRGDRVAGGDDGGVLINRRRGAAVLIGIPREDAVVELPALSIRAWSITCSLTLRLLPTRARLPLRSTSTAAAGCRSTG